MREPQDLNRLALLGTVSGGVRFRSASVGGELAEFALETAHRFDKGGHVRTERTRVEVIAWNGLAEFVRHNVREGDRLYVAGRLREKPLPKEAPRGAPREYEVVAERVIPHGSAPVSEASDDSLKFQG